jgi:Targeting protein for Xklp2 (TPX2) domain
MEKEEEIKRLRRELVPKALPMPCFHLPFDPKRLAIICMLYHNIDRLLYKNVSHEIQLINLHVCKFQVNGTTYHTGGAKISLQAIAG